MNSNSTPCFISQAIQTTSNTRNKVCMFAGSSEQTERRAFQVSVFQGELFWYKGRNSYGKVVDAKTQKGTRGSRDITATLLLLLILLTREVTTLACHLEKQSVRAVDVVVVVGSLRSLRSPPSLPFTHMVTKAAWFSLCIFSFIPYILTSLHVTTSTAIKAVDDNQSAD